jgi:hypothetical protein
VRAATMSAVAASRGFMQSIIAERRQNRQR